MKRLKPHNVFWILVIGLSLIFSIVKWGIPMFLHDDAFRRMVIIIFTIICLYYIIICVISLYDSNKNKRPRKWNIIEVINHVINYVFNIKFKKYEK